MAISSTQPPLSAASTDAAKGRAVKRQRKAFDQLLGVRVKLQPTLSAANNITSRTTRDDDLIDTVEVNDAIERAETAALQLWSRLNSLRQDLIEAKTGEKRKARNDDADSITKIDAAELWSQLEAQERGEEAGSVSASGIPYRQSILRRWAIKTRSAMIQPQQRLLEKSREGHSDIVDVLDGYIDKQLEKERGGGQRRRDEINDDAQDEVDMQGHIGKDYDDSAFYSLLLSDLLSQRSADTLNGPNITLDLQAARENARKSNRGRKTIDTKSSKGRKLRYTLHEKLQNFMAPEDRRTWSDRQVDELVGSLFGGALGLGEQVGDQPDVDGGAGVDGEERLRLFG